MITLKQLHDLEGSVWAKNITGEITPTNTPLWHAVSELASVIELFLPIEQAREVAPEAIWALEGAAEYFEEPTSHTVRRSPGRQLGPTRARDGSSLRKERAESLRIFQRRSATGTRNTTWRRGRR